MSTATATDAGAPAKGKKKLIIIAGGGVLVLVLAVVGVMMMTKKPPADDEAHEGPAKAAVAKRDPKAVPVFVPLDPFTVNLADRDAERYAQVGITLEVASVQIGDQMKIYMPAIRNNILMALADKTAADLQSREGKQLLATKVIRETSRALGYEVEDEEVAADEEEPPAKSKKKKKKPAPPELPVTAVHFSNFIIQ
jgi:flagellar protein FliL